MTVQRYIQTPISVVFLQIKWKIGQDFIFLWVLKIFSVEILQIVCFTPATYVSMKSSNKQPAWSVMLFPGDTVRVNFNKKAFGEYKAYNKETPYDSITTLKLQELWKKTIHIEGASFELPLPIHMKHMQLGFPLEYAKAHYNDNVDFTFKDPYAPELTYYRNTLGFLAISELRFYDLVKLKK